MLAGLKYGAKNRLAEEHFDKAIELCPDSPFPYIERANGVILMYGEDGEEEARQLLEMAVKMTPVEAMQVLDIERAKARLANL